MQRRVPIALILIALYLGLGGASFTTAQSGPAETGAPLTIVDPEGIIRGSVTVRELEDPFTGYDPSYPAAEGMRIVLLTVTFESALDQSLDAQPYHVVLQDSDGRLYSSVYVPRPADATVPDLQGQLMAPDNRVSGVMAYAVPEGAAVDRVIYQPASDRFLVVADLLPGAGPAQGDAVMYADAAGGSATITTEVTDPFTQHDPNYPPEAGSRFVMLREVFENVGQTPYAVDLYDLVLRDAAGYLYSPGTIYRLPDATVPMLEAQTMSPGDRVSGLVGYMVPAEAQITDVLYYPESGRIVSIADLVGGAAPAQDVEPPPTATPQPPESPAPTPPPASPTPDASAGTGR